MRAIFFLPVFFLTTLNANAQTNGQPSTTIAGKPAMPIEEQRDPNVREFRDMVALGVGIGQDYGGIGINLTVYPQKNIGVFGGIGYAFAGIGYNAGIKLRVIPEARFMKVSPYIISMYGYNATVKITDKPDYDKIFYGPSLGGGIDLRFRKNKGYVSFGITVPFRDAEVDEYMDMLEREYNVDFGAGLMPITFSIGCKMVIS